MEGGWRKRKRGRRRKGKGAGLKWERKRRAGAFEWSDGGARRRRRLASRAFDIAEDRVVFVHFYLYHFHWSKLTLRMGWGFVFFSMFVFQFHFSVEFAKWRTESDTKWRTKTRALNPFHNIPQKRRNNQKRRGKNQIVPKKKRTKKNKRSEENIVQKISQMFSRSLSFFSVILYIHILVARRGRSCIKGVLNYRLVPPRLAAATTLRGRPARSEGQAAAIFFCGGRELKCCRLVGSDFCGLFSISFVCFCFFGFISLLI